MKTSRILALSLTVAALAGCARGNQLEDGGVYTVRSACPQVAIPAGTGDITLFSPSDSTDASAIDISAAITNLRSSCSSATDPIVSTASFDVVATRRDASSDRQVTLLLFDVAMRGGQNIAAKKINQVTLNFPAGSHRAEVRTAGVVHVKRAATALSPEIRKAITTQRKVGELDAAIDPMSNPAVRDAVANATFEHLVGFQLTQNQLRYNLTR